MSIHHATKAKLAKADVTIQEAPEGSETKYTAFWPSNLPQIEFWYDDPKVLADAILAAKMASVEHHMAFEQDDEGVHITVGIKNPREIGLIEDLADLASSIPDALEALTSGEADEVVEADAEDQAEEDERSGSVVPDAFKKRYAEAGHPNTCGDWLALLLNSSTTGSNGKLDVDAMDEIARINKVDTSKLNRTSPGWQGRFRMTSRNMLVKVVAAAGFLLLPELDGDPRQEMAPSEWMAVNRPKIKEAGNKKAARALKGV